jgi:hypothetical protein
MAKGREKEGKGQKYDREYTEAVLKASLAARMKYYRRM